jgi:hypothetical protein
MFVRWKRHEGKRGTSHYAYLVQSQRVGGKPRLRVLRYLGGIKDAERHLPVLDAHNRTTGRYDFWCDVRRKLGSLDAATRQKVEAGLAAVVPALTADEDAAAEWAIEERVNALKRLMTGIFGGSAQVPTNSTWLAAGPVVTGPVVDSVVPNSTEIATPLRRGW